MDTLEYRYKPKPWVMLLVMLFFGATGAVLTTVALTNEKGLVILRIIHLSPPAATVFYWVLATFSGLFVIAGLAGTLLGLTSKQFLRLTPTELCAPRYAWSNAGTIIRISDITDVKLQQVHKERFLNIYHRGGKLSINASFLPSSAAFEELCRAIAARKQSAG